MDYTFQDDDDAARRRTWIVATAVALAFVIGAILLLRAGSHSHEAPSTEPPASNPLTATNAPLPTSHAPRPTSSSPLRRGGHPGGAGGSPAGVAPSPAGVAPPPSRSSGEVPQIPSASAGGKSTPAGASARALLAEGQDAERRDDLAAARSAYERALASPDVGDARPLVESRLGAVMVGLVSSPRAMPEKTDYTIARGDAVEKIARSRDTTTELVTKSNGIADPALIRPGKTIRILDNAKFEIVVSTSENWLLVKMNGKFFKRYTVGTGRDNGTPHGTFKITDKIAKPDWWKDNVKIPYGDERNILGTRWMALTPTGDTPPASGYGIHGTWDNSSLGQQSSAGCVRMNNTDVEELFMIIPKGTAVTIVE